MCRHAHRTLPCRPDSVAEGRHFVARTFAGWGLTRSDPAWAVEYDASLVVTELLSNAIRACVGPVELTIEGHARWVRLSVRDDNPDAATARHAATTAPDGRGLAIVAGLSTRWGQSVYQDGFKDVWADLAVAPGSMFAEGCTL